ncbi:MAG: hypothetical protein JO069_08510 [Verrucomicrobia bacterium]|nr:hypothetical protein [Verrucomicrobiota bacterium]
MAVRIPEDSAPCEGEDRFTVELTFHGDLGYFLGRQERSQPASPPPAVVLRVLNRKTSVKDVIEACGVPHPEVDLILIGGDPVGFSAQLRTSAQVGVFPVSVAGPFPWARLQARNVQTFLADGHLGKLVRDLRLLGIDVSYSHDVEDRELVATMVRENRALLTRDRPLLMHRVVSSGYCPRSQVPLEQTVEVIRRFDLRQKLAPFNRCLRCNGLLAVTPKQVVVDRLEPLTRLYYDEFQQCSRCAQTYWRGSHLAKLEKRVETVLARL